MAGNRGVTFYDDVTNGGVLNVVSGSTAFFFGGLAGQGNVGSGDVEALGDLLPDASAGTMAFGGSLDMGSSTTLEIELAGLLVGVQYDQLDIEGDVTLSGNLLLNLIDGFTLAAG